MISLIRWTCTFNDIHDKMEADGSEWEDLMNENDVGNEIVKEKVMVSTASQTGDHISMRSVTKEGTPYYARLPKP